MLSSEAEARHLRARVDWLTRYLNKKMPPAIGRLENIDTGTDLNALLFREEATTTTTTNTTTTPPAGSSSTPDSTAASAANDAVGAVLYGQMAAVDAASVDPKQQLSLTSANIDLLATGRSPPPLPRDAAARGFVDAYFRNVNRAYPFVDRAKVLDSLESMRDVFGSGRQRDAASTILYLVMAIGCTTLQRAGQIPGDTASRFDIAYAEIIQECVAREDVESLQILLLLALYSLFDPHGTPVWPIVGIVSRKALQLGLSRKNSEDKTMPAAEVERQRRLFWGIYVLDRMTAISLGLSVTLVDENTDVPLPGLTVEEYTSLEKPYFTSILQTNRHVIQLRQIEDRILRDVLLANNAKVALVSAADRQAILHDIRTRIEDWYSHGCLVSPLEPDNVPIHNTITWQSARYYHLLLLLYYPCRFNSFGPVSPAELLRLAQKHLQSTSVLLLQRQLPLNRITLCRLLPVSLIVLRSMVHSPNGSMQFAARDEVAVILSVLEAFPDSWLQAHQLAHILRQFLATISGVSETAMQFAASSSYVNFDLGLSRDACHAMLRPVLDGLIETMHAVLGKATCYDFQDLPGEWDPGYQPPNITPLSASLVSTSAPAFTAVASSDRSPTNYDWAPLELGFI